MILDWVKCGRDWCSFRGVDLSNSHFDNLVGVYVIWYAGADAATVYVGQGDIAERIRAHRIDSRFDAYSRRILHASWAQVGPTYRDGIERYLIDQLRPLISQVGPVAAPIGVNYPWS